MNDAEIVLAHLYEVFGRAVFLVLPRGTKELKDKGWQDITYEQTQTAEYQAGLLEAIKRGGNLAVRLGPLSGGLRAIDIDTDKDVQPFMSLNPHLAGITRRNGEKGCQIFFRTKPGTLYPNNNASFFLKNLLDDKWGEWRVGDSGGAYSLVLGQHPNKRDHFHLSVDVAVGEQDFSRIGWPPEVLLPWAKAEPPPHTKAKHTGTPTDLDKRIRAYLDKVDQAIMGEGGSNPTFWVACVLVNDWALDRPAAIQWMHYYSETRCRPPWTDKEIEHKIDDAFKAPHRRSRGCLRDETGHQWHERRKREAREHDYRQKVESGEIPPQEDHSRDEGDDYQEPERGTGFSGSIIKAIKLSDIELPPRKMIIDDWFKEGDLGFIFAYRGAGKTWLTIDLCRAIADAGKCGPWQVNGKWPVLYIDGEMSYDDIKSRITGLGEAIPENLYVLNHEVLFHYHKLVMNFGNVTDQGIITKICLDKGLKVLVLDNLGCLVSGVEENKADEWEKILPWLLELRRLGISVIIVHHTGHDSTRMRGTVKREDSAAWVLRLDDQREDYSEAGAWFISRFRKLRGQKSVPDYEWHYEPSGAGGVLVTFKEANRADIVLQWVRDGLTSATAIAKEMGVSEGAVSKLATKLIKEGILTKKGREYVET